MSALVMSPRPPRPHDMQRPRAWRTALGRRLAGGILVLVPALAVIATPSTASAQAASAADRAEATRLFNLGRIAFRAERYDEAILRWQESYALSAEPLILYNIGLAFEKLGNHKQAAENLRAWREHAPAKEHAELDRKIAENERLAAEQEPEPEPEPEPDPEPPPPPKPPPKAPEDDGTALRLAGISLMGVGGAAVVAGIVMDAVAAANRPDESEACVTTGTQLLCRDASRSDIESSNTLAIAGDVTWIAGLALAGAGISLYLLAPDGADEEASDEAASASIAITPGGGAFQLRVPF